MTTLLTRSIALILTRVTRLQSAYIRMACRLYQKKMQAEGGVPHVATAFARMESSDEEDGVY